MIAIQTKYIPATNTVGSAIRARAEYGRKIAFTTMYGKTVEYGRKTIGKTIPYPHEYNAEGAHRAAALALIDKVNSNGGAWPINFVTGSLPDGSYCHVLQH